MLKKFYILSQKTRQIFRPHADSQDCLTVNSSGVKPKQLLDRKRTTVCMSLWTRTIRHPIPWEERTRRSANPNANNGLLQVSASLQAKSVLLFRINL